jgi:monofunctional biosynthetic peptidoglycan transglycosylase
MLLELVPERWQVINDGVMGGRSSSEVIVNPAGPLLQGLLFRGQISLENNGGFASARCRFTQGFAGTSAFRLVVRGDGRNYQFRLRADERPGSIAWQAVFSTDGSRRQLIDIPLDAFDPVFRGRRMEQAGKLEPAEMYWLGFMLADRRPGNFAIEVHRIEAMQNSLARFHPHKSIAEYLQGTD